MTSVRRRVTMWFVSKPAAATPSSKRKGLDTADHVLLEHLIFFARPGLDERRLPHAAVAVSRPPPITWG